MQNSIFQSSQNIFLDTVIVKDYIQFDKVSTVYQSLLHSIKKPLKMILVYGKPGTGKSMFLSKLYEDLNKTQKIYLYKTPILDESEFFKTLAQDLLAMSYNGELNFTQFMKTLESSQLSTSENIPLILLDESQLYSDSIMEKIRLLSDTRKVKFIIALHKTKEEDLIAKEHFQTRIWESIELKNASISDLKTFIRKKLLQKEECFNVAQMFNDKAIGVIHSLTDGNYRDTNKLLFTMFEIYMYYSQNNPAKISKNTISIDIIEMAAIHTGLINA